MKDNKEVKGLIMDMTCIDDDNKDIYKRIVNKFGAENVHGLIMPYSLTCGVSDQVEYCEKELGIKCTIIPIKEIKDSIIKTYEREAKDTLNVMESDVKYKEGKFDEYLDCFMAEASDYYKAETKLEENIRKALLEFTAHVTRKYYT